MEIPSRSVLIKSLSSATPSRQHSRNTHRPLSIDNAGSSIQLRRTKWQQVMMAIGRHSQQGSLNQQRERRGGGRKTRVGA